MHATPFPPIVSACTQCGNQSGMPFSVTTDGPSQVLLGFRCRLCWAEWLERRPMSHMTLASPAPGEQRQHS